MLASGAGIGPSVNGIVGAQGPALGIRRPNEVAVQLADGGTMSAEGARISFQTSARTETDYVVTQQTAEPITTLNSLGSIVDAKT